ncbi:hypothetical protein ACFLSJ_07320 [Verrucomicrobiota bacterium]
MKACLLILSVRCALPAALIISPWLAARLLLPRARAPLWLAACATACVFLNTAMPLFLHWMQVPITPATLAAGHWVVAAVLVLSSLPRLRRVIPEGGRSIWTVLCIAAAFALLVLPWTNLAGIDTYKWQGLATNVQVERCVPWVVHPISLLGFTPRAYPPIQPLLLATVQMLGGLGVRGGFYLVSVLCGILAASTSFLLGQRFFRSDRAAGWLAFLYVFSPVFVRYGHWATGRGFFLALVPLLILFLLDSPRLRALAGFLFVSLLLLLSHKTGLVAVALIAVTGVGSVVLPRAKSRILVIAAVLPFLALAVLLSSPFLLPPPLGLAAGFVRTAVTRFGWLVPAWLAGLLIPRAWLSSSEGRRTAPAMLLAFPMAFHSEMYGAMIALVFVCLPAAALLSQLLSTYPRFARPLTVAAGVLTLAAAGTIVVHRSVHAAPDEVVVAARFLNEHDPLGPYDVESPGRTRVQIHAYVTGCPRFNVTLPETSRVAFEPPPSLRGPVRKVFAEWVDYTRNLLEIPDVEVDWYGRDPGKYYVEIDGRGSVPDDAVLLFDQANVRIYSAP